MSYEYCCCSLMDEIVCVCVKLTCEQLDAVEDGVIDTVLATVLRLPEMNFRSAKFIKVLYPH